MVRIMQRIFLAHCYVISCLDGLNYPLLVRMVSFQEFILISPVLIFSQYAKYFCALEISKESEGTEESVHHLITKKPGIVCCVVQSRLQEQT